MAGASGRRRRPGWGSGRARARGAVGAAMLALAFLMVFATAGDCAESWAVVGADVPSSLEWDEVGDVAIEVLNDGTEPWTAEYALRSAAGPTEALVPVSRWGLTFVPVAGITPPAVPSDTRVFEFTVTAPPISTLIYDGSAPAASPALAGGLSCEWVMWRGGEPVTTDVVDAPVVISRFPDIQPGTEGEWARFFVEECTGRVPEIVKGFDEGSYRPRVTVTRDAMAVFIRRSMKIPTEPWQGTFPDVDADHWAAADIEALVAAGVVLGYPDGLYHPADDVTRDQMATYVARGSGYFLPRVTEDVFPDVPMRSWAATTIKACVDHGVVYGYDDGLYHPERVVSRDQMAAYLYRAFIQPTDSAVVLGGPAVTHVDPRGASYDGWSSTGESTTLTPGYAYVVFDAVRIGGGLAVGENEQWDVVFELFTAPGPRGAPVASETISLTAEDLDAVREAAVSSGDPYVTLYWELPAGLAPGGYQLEVRVEDDAGTLHRLVRRPELSLRQGTVLILYDSSGPYGWLGEIYATHLANLLGHFEADYETKPVEEYVPGDIDRAYVTFYVGAVYENPLPPAFVRDAISSPNTICWLKYNLWQVAWEFAEFESTFGFGFFGMDWSGYSEIGYKGETFGKYQDDPELGVVTISDPSLCREVATASLPPEAPEPDSIPYVVQSRNLWYVADVPLSYTGEEDRYIAFCDLLHDILGMDHAESRRAMIRIEDVDPTASPAAMRAIADYLYSESVPFAVGVIPVYNDPLGEFNLGVPLRVEMSEVPEFISALEYMESKGGTIILHGYTHQYESLLNPYNGVTGDDFEFYRVLLNADDTLTYVGPVPADSAAWMEARVEAARQELHSAGFVEAMWETPHYAASATDYGVLATLFPAVFERMIYFVETADGGESTVYAAGQFFPYVIHRDVYGLKVLPENLGNVEPEPWHSYPARLPEDIVRAASKNLVVRDAWAVSYFHHFYSIGYLQDVIEGIKGLGYTYVPVSVDLQ